MAADERGTKYLNIASRTCRLRIYPRLKPEKPRRTKNEMKLLFEWLENAPHRAPKEAATLCSLAIIIGGQNACRH